MEWDTKYLKKTRQQVRLNDRMLAMARLKERERHTNKLLEFRLENANELARLSYLSLGTLHDIATPLTTLILNLEHLKTKYNDEFIDRAFYSGSQIEKIISTFRNEITPKDNKETFNVCTEIANQLDVLKHKIEENKIKVNFKNIEKTTIYGNKTKFSQLILNLLANAIEAHKSSTKPTKSLRINIKNMKKAVYISIKDNAKGISQKNLKRLFMPFYTTKKDSNLGLGLYICKEIVHKDFGGTIKIDSKINEYTKVTINLNKKF